MPLRLIRNFEIIIFDVTDGPRHKKPPDEIITYKTKVIMLIVLQPMSFSRMRKYASEHNSV